MFKLIRRLSVLVVIAWAGSANAASMPPVTVYGKEWLQPLDFLSYSWNNISTVCNPITGACNGSLGDNDLTGWTWASVEDINALFNHYIGPLILGPGPDGGPEFNVAYSGDSWIYSMIQDGFAPTESIFGFNYLSGLVRTQSDAATSYVGGMGVSDSDGDYGPDVQWVASNTEAAKATPAYRTGAWFIRESNASSVPVTNSLALVGLGLCALGISGRIRTLPT